MRGVGFLLLAFVAASLAAGCEEEVVCVHGHYDCHLRQCVCDPGWENINCSSCVSDESCPAHHRCNHGNVPHLKKTFQCTLLDKSLTDLLGGGQVVYTCERHDGTTSCNVQIWKHAEGPPEVFGCMLEDCAISHDMLSGSTTTKCMKTNCTCGPRFECNDILSTILSGMHTVAEFNCNAGHNCSFTQKENPIEILIHCTGGECVPTDDCVPEAECVHGTYSCQTKKCECEDGWSGFNCTVCTGDGSCDGDATCDTSVDVTKQKSFECDVLNPTIKQQLGGGGVGITCHFDEDSPFCDVQIWHKATGPPLIFGCTLSECRKENNLVDGDVIDYKCDKTVCDCGPTWGCSDELQKIIDMMKTTSKLECHSDGTCVFRQHENPLIIDIKCRSGECVAPADVIPPPPKKVTTWQWSLLVVASTFVVAGIILGAALVARHRRRKEFERVELLAECGDPDFGVVEGAAGECTLSWHNVSFSVKKSRGAEPVTLLHDCSGVARPGTLTAFMGASGAGKTSLLDILAGRKNTGVVTGEVLVNGVPRDGSFKRVAGYVMQDDNLMPTLTVRESIMYSAELRLPASMTDAQKMARVLRVMEDLGLSHIADSRIGNAFSRGISGGERKRVSIACELVTSPQILFLDEPTSGLDSSTAHSIMRCLHALAESGKTICFSIHQPRSNIFHLFDNLVLLTKGREAFVGPARDALGHFAVLGHDCPRDFNPADFLLDVVTMSPEDTVARLVEHYTTSPTARTVSQALSAARQVPRARLATFDTYGDEDSDIDDMEHLLAPASPVATPAGSINGRAATGRAAHPSSSPRRGQEAVSEYATSAFHQFCVLCRRATLNTVRNPFLLRAHYVVAIALGLLLGSIYYDVTDDLPGVQDRSGALFFIIALLSFGSLSSLETFISERALFVHERANGCYRTSAYFMAKALCDIIPLRVLPPLLLSMIVYYMIGLAPSPASHFLWFAFIIALVNVTATGMCLAVGAIVPSVAVGNLVAVLVMLFMMLFGGFLVNRDHVPAVFQMLQSVSFFDYAFEALMVNELADLEISFNPKGFDAIPLSGTVVLDNLAMDPERFASDVAVLAAMAAAYLLVAYLLLRFCVRERR